MGGVVGQDAIAAIDTLWDFKGKALGVPGVTASGRGRARSHPLLADGYLVNL